MDAIEAFAAGDTGTGTGESTGVVSFEAAGNRYFVNRFSYAGDRLPSRICAYAATGGLG